MAILRTVPLQRGATRREQCLLSANLGCTRLQFASKLALYSLARALRRREIYLPKGVFNIRRTRTEGLSTDLRTPHSCIFFPFYPYSIIANFLAVILVPTFCRPKSSQKAQHRQNQSLSSLLRNFSKPKYPSFVARLPATFP